MDDTIYVNEAINTTSKYITKFLNSLPHLNMWFIQTNSTFDPYNPEYLETILFWSTVPILVLILILLLLIIYACCLVCTSNSRLNSKHQQHHHQQQQLHLHHQNDIDNLNNLNSSSTNNNLKLLKSNKTILCKQKTVIFILLVLLSVSLAAIVYGSEKFHYSYFDLNKNINNFSLQFKQINDHLIKTKELINNDLMNKSLSIYNTQITNNQQQQQQSPQQQPQQQEQIHKLKNELEQIKNTLNQSLQILDNVYQYLLYENNSYKQIIKETDKIEQTRWGIMIGIVTVNLVLIVLLVVGLIRNSKGSLCFFAFAGVLALISIWILNALYLGLSVFISDYCVNPHAYTLDIANRNNIDKDIVLYYTKCIKSSNAKQSLQPFEQQLKKAQTKLNTAQTRYTDNLMHIGRTLINEDLVKDSNFTKLISNTYQMISDIQLYIKCDQTSYNYNQIINVLCFNSIFGLAVVLIAGLLFGFVLPILICIIPQLWRRMHNIYCDDNEEGHPFIPVNTQTRSNISAARQYNDSPNFQRLNHQTSINTDPYIKTTSTSTSSNNNANTNQYQTASTTHSAYYMQTASRRM